MDEQVEYPRDFSVVHMTKHSTEHVLKMCLLGYPQHTLCHLMLLAIDESP
jgi:hypothetical protein